MKYEAIVIAVNRIIAQYDMPLTLRQIYYRLVAAGLIPNRRAAYNGLSSQLVTARENGEVDEARIVDRSRRIEDVSFDTPHQFVNAAKYTIENRYVRRFWQTQERYVEVWVEKDALSQVLATAVYGYNTIVAPSRGYSSFTYLKDAGARLSKYSQYEDGTGEHEVVILHFADHDPSGLDMSRDLDDRLRRYSGIRIQFKRIALTHDQVVARNLIPNPTKLADPRSSGYVARYGNQCWELDAIEPNDLVEMCRNAVEEEIDDWDAWEAIKRADKGERDTIKAKLIELEKSLPEEWEKGGDNEAA